MLWLDGVEKKYVEEVGSMNIMFKIDGEIYTAPCVGTVLPGVTRRSIIELLKDWGYKVHEERVAIADIMKVPTRASWRKSLAPARLPLSPLSRSWIGRQGCPHQRRPHRRADPEAV